MRTVCSARCAVFGGSALVTLVAVQSAKAQAQLDPIPGIYHIADNCQPAQFPSALPPLDSVLNLDAFDERLTALKVNKRVILALRLGSFAASPRVRVVEKKVSQQLAEQVAMLVDENLRDIPPDAPWSMRLRIDSEKKTAPALEPSEVCAAEASRSGSVVTRSEIVRASDMAMLQAQMEARAADYRRRVFNVLVAADGAVVELKIINSGTSYQDALDQAEAINTGRFRPSTLDGEPVTAWVEIGGR